MHTAIKTCSKSFEQQSQERQVDKLQAGAEQPLTVLPQPPVPLPPRKAALNHQALGHHLEGMWLAALDYLHADVCAQSVLHTPNSGLAYIFSYPAGFTTGISTWEIELEPG